MIALRVYLMMALVGLAATSAPVPSIAAEAHDAQAQANKNASQTTSSAVASEANSADARLSASLDVTAASKYLFQGIDYSEGRTVFQPNLVATFAGFSAVVWSNYQPDLNVMNEVDLSLKYTRTLQKLSITPGYTYLAYPNRDWDPSQELFVDLGLEAPFSPSLSIHYDFDAGQGTFATLGMSHGLRAPVTVGASLFYQNQYYEMSGFPAAELKLNASWSVGAISFTPQISRFVTWENQDFRGAAGIPSNWVFSLNGAVPLSF